MGGGTPEEHLLIILPWAKPTAQLEQIQEHHPKLKITYRQLTYTSSPWVSAEEIPRELYNSATILATLVALPPAPSDAPLLRYIHFFSAGTNHVSDHPIYTDTDITLTTSSGIHGPQISEWVLMTASGHSHMFRELLDFQRRKRWDKTDHFRSIHDMVGQRLGVLGYGSIGRQVARVGKAMGMDVIAYTASPRKTKESKKDRGFIVPGTGDPDGDIPSEWYSGMDKDSLRHFLKQDIDILLISVPLTKETTHFLAKEEFEILGRTRNAFISNISRGQIVQQDDMIAALKKRPEDGGLRGAALDVADPEPLPEDSELWDLPNVILTPHISGSGSAYVDRAFQVLDLNLVHLEKGEKLINVVNRKRGY
ncbi:MAG: hypothetical protein M1837_001531 [Sclerophora amabilis]|nr:MAG: hypothetical protein M1837_001531 [Sclerophora amabilis]